MLATVTGCPATQPVPTHAWLKVGRLSSQNKDYTDVRDAKDLRAIRIYVHHEGKTIELDQDDLVILEYVTADGLVLDPNCLTFSVGKPPSPSDKEKPK
jgi:hypothetical protein